MNIEIQIDIYILGTGSEQFHRPEMSQIKAEISLRTNVTITTSFQLYKGLGAMWSAV